ncbi:hypothetical protein X773_23215 [Mesorhizobium sp. LSJC285A00]|uniref:hypothetical protein n=1 Tax=Mesorhizobium sp. LSJC285A00 TaxID=1287338 RepID=UPI0003CE709E|nr:hypothetical protein [Mesorhizobium sp. LSJC285A00]ESW77630.1 hypothetical protein X773_23215 [Mesorhizobium sp. LSJC285A00]
MAALNGRITWQTLSGMNAAEFRSISGRAEFRAAESCRLRSGEGDTPDPAELIMVTQAEGGVAADPFVDGRLIGYVFGLLPSGRACNIRTDRLCFAGAPLEWRSNDTSDAGA